MIFGTSLIKRGRSFLRTHYRSIFISVAFIFFTYATYLSSLQYYAMQNNSIAELFLPPHQSISYFIVFIAGARICGPYLISLIASLIFMSVANKYNLRYNERFFEKEEIQLGGLSFFLVGHPGWIFYFPLLIFIYLLIQIFNNLVLRRANVRIPVYHLWVPTAIFVILISVYWLSGTQLWRLLKI